MTAYRGHEITGTGKRRIVFDKSKSLTGISFPLPCGQCVGCRLQRSAQWAVRCVHEASLYQDNCFITLTYSDEHLPPDRSLHVEHYQKFMKRLRKKFTGRTIRFFHCGEYGPKLGRPHYHACLFNIDFEDKELWKMQNGTPIYLSDTLSTLWPFGFSTLGTVTFESAAYVARYIMKKVTGKGVDEIDQETGLKPYETTCESTGEIIQVHPEYTTMSRGGRTGKGIAHGWFEQFKRDVYPSDFLTIQGKKFPPPKYYDGLYEIENPGALEKLKQDRKRRALEHAQDQTPERLAVREKCKLEQIKNLKRPYEETTI